MINNKQNIMFLFLMLLFNNFILLDFTASVKLNLGYMHINRGVAGIGRQYVQQIF